MSRSLARLSFLLFAACDPTLSDTDPAADTDPPVTFDVCGAVRDEPRAFDASGATGLRRHDLAADFEVPLRGGGTWGLKADWTGCESIIVVTQTTPVSASDPRSIWTTSVSRLIGQSDENVVYLFIPSGLHGDVADAATDALREEIDTAIAQLRPQDQDWWRARLLISATDASSLAGWVGELLQTERGAAGFAIDRFQRVRDLGALKAYDAPTGGEEAHPYENALYPLAYEARRFEREVYLQDELDEYPRTDVTVLDGVLTERVDEVTVELPDAATMQTFDRVDVDLELRCPDPDLPEVDSCGPGGHVGHVWYLPDEGEAIEALRFVTAYGREGRYLGPSAQILPFLMSGGRHRFRVEWSPSGEPEPSRVHLTLRFQDRGRDERPVKTVRLWTGGPVSASYDDDRPPVPFTRTAQQVRVEHVVMVTGHGRGTNDCASLCPMEFFIRHGESTTRFSSGASIGAKACQDSFPFKSVPNQHGDWWTQRSRWCTGQSFGKRGVDIAHNLPIGEAVPVGTSLVLNGTRPQDGDYGHIELGAWLVVWE